jgi:hypothetical protein
MSGLYETLFGGAAAAQQMRDWQGRNHNYDWQQYAAQMAQHQIPTIGELAAREQSLENQLRACQAELAQRRGDRVMPAPTAHELDQSPALRAAYEEMMVIWRLSK